VDEHGHEVAPGQVGELVVRGSHVMKGYWNLAEETKRALRPGALPGESVLYTGDLFRMDEEGFLYFVGRKDNIIKTRGQKVSPVEVEAVLCQFEGVAEVAVVAVPDEILGQAIKALIVPQKDRQIGEKDVRAFCAHHLEDYKVPKWIDFRDTLPKTSSGKIDRKTLVNVVESKA
jgi:acyl-CoA synthetase (AMP-forming)/AMP-acid ligase II